MALKADGTIVSWGSNFQGEGDVPPNLSNVVAIATGAYHSLALKNDGTVVAWGDNTYGQIDQPPGLTNIVAIASGGFHSLALRTMAACYLGRQHLWPIKCARRRHQC